jgi:hypothetical protein
MAEDAITHKQAMTLLREQLGKQVFVNLTALDTNGSPVSVMRLQGTLARRRMVGGDEPPADPGARAAVAAFSAALGEGFTVDGSGLMLPPLPRIVRECQMGLEWVLAEGLTLRINW